MLYRVARLILGFFLLIVFPTSAEEWRTGALVKTMEFKPTRIPILVVLAVSLVPGHSARSFAGAADAALRASPAPSVALDEPAFNIKEFLEKEPAVFGVSLEEKAQGRWTQFRKQLIELVQFRQGSLDSKKKLAWIEACAENPGSDFLCELLMEPKARARVKAALDDSPKDSPLGLPLVASIGDDEDYGKLSLDQIRDHLVNGRWSSLKGESDSKMYRAIRGLGDLALLKKTAAHALTPFLCPNPAIYFGFGSKLEEHFPDSEAKDLAKKSYEKAYRCARNSEFEGRVGYRLSLLMIWEGECTRADPILEKLATDKDGDYFTRSIFWRAYCAESQGKKEIAQKLKAKLYRESPLSYHGLLLGNKRSDRAKELLGVDSGRQTASFFQYRSKKNPALNGWVRALELLIEMKRANSEGARTLASSGRGQRRTDIEGLIREVFNRINQDVATAETPFRVYLASLMHHAVDPIGVFRTLAGIFRDDPTAISRSTLEIFYPLKRLAILQKHGQKLDPYFVAALIRQESGFNEWARSRTGALGLMQIMPQTARMMERVSQKQLLDPSVNVRLGVRYFGKLLGRYDNDAELALAAYNAGPERVDDWLRRYPIAQRALFFDLIPFKETRDYVALIARNYYWYLSLYREGIDLDTVTVRNIASRHSIPLTFTLFSDQKPGFLSQGPAAATGLSTMPVDLLPTLGAPSTVAE